ncbi:MAG: tRNA 2-thiouridine(34) synthase MnmA [Peptostreptococcaceae bacterium]|nr:tRNA 2-thiouridine(34) synthase MnmA [Peptostreptococcaceae bacterium]
MLNVALNKNKVLLGLSGGVDSTAAALLLKKDGLKVTGLFFDVNEIKGKASESAKYTAKQLEINFVYKNVSQSFTDIVIHNFCKEYTEGRTPNPCVICNPSVKFKTLIEEADKIGAYYIATGHYAGVYFNENNGCYYIKQAENIEKDQSYMLYRLEKEILSRLLLPLDHISDKEETRNLVRTEEISNSEQKDSQEICFISKGENYMNYIKSRGYESQPGNFINKNGNYLGKHSGLVNYTIGQRKGLGITFGKPVFVSEVNHNNNTVTLGDNKDLFRKMVTSKDNVFVFPEGKSPEIYNNAHVTAKIRYAARPMAATLNILENGFIETNFEEMQRAITPGQSVVFYQENLVIGGGFIV